MTRPCRIAAGRNQNALHGELSPGRIAPWGTPAFSVAETYGGTRRALNHGPLADRHMTMVWASAEFAQSVLVNSRPSIERPGPANGPGDSSILQRTPLHRAVPCWDRGWGNSDERCGGGGSALPNYWSVVSAGRSPQWRRDRCARGPQPYRGPTRREVGHCRTIPDASA